MPRRSPAPRIRTLTTLLALLALPAVGACGSGETDGAAMEADALQAAAEPITAAEVDALRSGFLEAMDAGNVGTAAAFYAEDAVFHHPDGSKSRGRAEIQQHLASMAGSGPASDVVLTLTDMGTGPSLAWETGTFSATITPDVGEPATAASNYLIVLERQPDGSIRIVQDAEWPMHGEGEGEGG